MADANALKAVLTKSREYLDAEKKRADMAKKLRAQTDDVNKKFEELQAVTQAAEMVLTVSPPAES
jgi:hypothetical protein